MTPRVTDTDKGLRALIARLSQASGRTLLVGVMPNQKFTPKRSRRGRSGTNLLRVAMAMEFGEPANNVPARPYLRSTLAENERQLSQDLLGIGPAVVAGEDPTTLLMEIGRSLSRQMRAKIDAGIGPALQPETIKRKGSSKPLVDTGQLRDAITFEVRNG